MVVKHVLVVDDSKSARFMLRKMLGKINLTADLAESGEEALTYLQSAQPDAIFMDHMMPGLNGLETVEQIKKNPQTSVIPIIMYTSQDSDEYKSNVISYGVADILPKPASIENLNSVVSKLNELPKVTLGQIPVKPTEKATKGKQPQVSTNSIVKLVRKTAEAAVAAAVRVQVMAATAQHLSRFKIEVKKHFCDEKKTRIIAEKVFDNNIKNVSDNFSQQIQEVFTSLSTEISNISEHTGKTSNKLDTKMLNEIKDVARISSTNKAVEVAKETASIISRDSMIAVTEAINEANQKMATRMTIAAVIASCIGIFSALAVYLLLS